MPPTNISPKQLTGKRGELLAADFLKAQGFTVTNRNWRHGRAEVDLIVQRDRLLVFVEVKARKRIDFGYPEQFVSPGQAKRIVKAADAYLFEQPWEGDIRFDIVAIELGQAEPEIVHFEDAFY